VKFMKLYPNRKLLFWEFISLSDVAELLPALP